MSLNKRKNDLGHPSGLVVSDADFCAVGSGFESGEDMEAASPLVRLVEEEEKWEAPDHTQGVFLQNWGETELNHSITCMVLKATANDRRPSAMMNFVGLDLAFADQPSSCKSSSEVGGRGTEVVGL
ncbi:hypothetical protein TNCV_46911 [Trichonephila clavipes]|nr:hypothetical protein TNCV_46911 [Trichonephila clavipes]